MIKIVRWEVSEDETFTLPASVTDRLSDCCQWAALPRDDKRILVSPPMPHFSETCERIKDVCRSVYSARRVDMTKEYTLVITNAPESYDYGYCIPLGLAQVDKDMPKTSTPPRLVAMPPEHTEYQRARYSSGVYWSRTVGY